jgi:peroxiredoxin
MQKGEHGFEREVANESWKPVTRDVPAIQLPSTNGSVRLAEFCAERAVLYVYPATGVPGRDPAIDPAPGWDDIPGAAGCTPQSLGFKSAYADFARQGIRVAGVSTQPLAEQKDFAERHQLPFPLLCDEELGLQGALALPTFKIGSRTFLKRLVLYVEGMRLRDVISAISSPADSAQQMLALLHKKATRSGQR